MRRRRFLAESALRAGRLARGTSWLPGRADGHRFCSARDRRGRRDRGGRSGRLCGGAGGASGTAARVVMTEPTDWIGGQLTSQAVPPDEHPWIEQFGASASYRKLRQEIRDVLSPALSADRRGPLERPTQPGKRGVSAFATSRRVALAALTALLAPYASSGRLLMLLEHEPIAREREGRPGAIASRCAIGARWSSARCTRPTSSTRPSWAIFCRWRASNS